MRCRSRTSRLPQDSWGCRRTSGKQTYQMAVRVVGRLSDPQRVREHYSEEPGRARRSGTGAGLVLLKDVGRAEVGAENYNTSLKFSGGDAVGVGIQQLANANALDVAKKCRAVLAELKKSFPPGMDVSYRGRYDAGGFGLDPRGAEHAGRRRS